jgi:hypothetical protein
MNWEELTPGTEVTILGVNFNVLYGSARGGVFLHDGDSLYIFADSVGYKTTALSIPENQQTLHHVESHVRLALRTLQRGMFDLYREWRGVSKSIDSMLAIETSVHDGKVVGDVQWTYRPDPANIRVEYVAAVAGTEVILVTGPMMEGWSAETPLGYTDLDGLSFEEAAAEALAFYRSMALALATQLQGV